MQPQDPQAPEPRALSPREEALQALSQFPGFNEALQRLRAEPRPVAPAGPAPGGSTPLAPAWAPGGEKDAVDQFAVAYPGFDERLKQIQAEIPEPVKRADTWWGTLRDIGGKALDLLDLPAEGAERLIGMAYWNEIPLVDRWSMAHLTYDTMSANLYSGGRSRSDLIADYEAGKSIDSIIEENENPWADMGGHFLLDPLWLVGGIPLITKVLPASVKGTKAGQLAIHGINFSKIPLVRDVPVLGKIGMPVKDEMLARTMVDMAGQVTQEFSTGRKAGVARKWAELSPKGHVDRAVGALQTAVAGLNDPRYWLGDGDTALNGKRVALLFQDLMSPSNLRTEYAGLYSSSAPIQHVRALMQDNPGNFRSIIRNLKSLGEVNLNDKFWEGGKAFLATTRDGVGTNIVDLIRAGSRLQPEEAARYATFRYNHLFKEVTQESYRHLSPIFGVPEDARGLVDKVDSFSAGMKGWLSLFSLNNPKFVSLNYLSNAFHIAAKTGDVGAGVRYLRHPHSLSAAEIARATEMGFGDDFVKALSNDLSFTEAVVPELGASIKSMTHDMVKKIGWFLSEAERLDQGGRQRAVVAGIQDASYAVWKFGEGGVLPAMDDALRAIPGFEDAVRAGAMKGFDYLDTLKAMTLGDEAITGRGVIASALDEIAQAQGLDAGAARLMHRDLPDALQAEFDEVIDAVRAARRGGGDYLTTFYTKLDDMADDLELLAFRKMSETGAKLPPIPMGAVRDRVMPWQDVAHRQVLKERVQELVTRYISAQADEIGNEAAYSLIGQVERGMSAYLKMVDDLYDGVRGLPAGQAPPLYQHALKTMDDHLDAVLRALDDEVPGYAEQLGIPLREMFNSGMVARLDDAASGAARIIAAQDQEMGRLGQIVSDLGFEMPREFANLDEFPTVGKALAQQSAQMQQVLDIARRTVPDLFSKSRPVDAETAAKISDYVETGLRQAMRERNIVATHHARATRDWVMHNYTQKYGIDSAIQLVFPYSFWLSRSMRDWGRMTLARPGITAAMTRFYQSAQDINEDANLPERLKTSLRIPIPFLDDALQGLGAGAGQGAIYFDPIRVLNPMAGLQVDENFDRGLDLTPFGQMYSWVGQVSPFGLNPFMTGALGASGALGDRDTYVQRMLTSFNNVPSGIIGPRLVRAVSDYFTGISEDPDPEVFDARVRQAIANGEPMPEPEIKSWFQSLTGLGNDGFDGFRIDRMVAAMVAEDPHRWTPRAGLEAMRLRQGPLYDEARKRAGTQQGLSVLSGWMFMPLRLYPEGERVQQGLDAMYRIAVASRDEKQLDEFFEKYPEYQARRAAYAPSDADRAERLDTSLFYEDLGEVERTYERSVLSLRNTLTQMENAGYLQTKEGRRQHEIVDGDLRFLLTLRQNDIDRLDALYPDRKTAMSLSAAPHERAMHALREEYFAITPDQFKTASEFYAARDRFIATLPKTSSADQHVAMAALAKATWNAASDRLAQQPDNMGEIITARNATLEKLTADLRGTVSQSEFRAYLARNARPKTAAAVEYAEAAELINEYFAIAEAPGVTAANKRVLQKNFWQSHPLLEKYYGASEPAANNETAAAIGLMNKVWDGYYALGGNPRGQRDYLVSHLAELNALRQRVGLPKVQLVNWERVLPDAFKHQATSPIQSALRSQQPATGPAAPAR